MFAPHRRLRGTRLPVPSSAALSAQCLAPPLARAPAATTAQQAAVLDRLQGVAAVQSFAKHAAAQRQAGVAGGGFSVDVLSRLQQLEAKTQALKEELQGPSARIGP